LDRLQRRCGGQIDFEWNEFAAAVLIEKIAYAPGIIKFNTVKVISFACKRISGLGRCLKMIKDRA